MPHKTKEARNEYEKERRKRNPDVVFNDNTALLRKAAEYLEKYNEP